MKPAIRINRLSGCLRQLPVALHHTGTAHEQFVTVPEFRLNIGQSRSDRVRIDRPHFVHGDNRRMFSHAIPLNNPDAEAKKDPRDRGIQRGAARYKAVHVGVLAERAADH